MKQAIVVREQVEQAEALEMALWKRLLESISAEAQDLLYAYDGLAMTRKIVTRELRWGCQMTSDRAQEWFRESVQHAEHTLAMAVALEGA